MGCYDSDPLQKEEPPNKVDGGFKELDLDVHHASVSFVTEVIQRCVNNGGSFWVQFLGFLLKVFSVKLSKVLAFEDLSTDGRFISFLVEMRVLVDVDKLFITDLLFPRLIV